MENDNIWSAKTFRNVNWIKLAFKSFRCEILLVFYLQSIIFCHLLKPGLFDEKWKFIISSRGWWESWKKSVANAVVFFFSFFSREEKFPCDKKGVLFISNCTPIPLSKLCIHMKELYCLWSKFPENLVKTGEKKHQQGWCCSGSFFLSNLLFLLSLPIRIPEPCITRVEYSVTSMKTWILPLPKKSLEQTFGLTFVSNSPWI